MPVACVADSKPHIRTFLGTTLEDLGFAVHECARYSDVMDALSSVVPDLFVVGLLVPESAVTETIRSLAAKRYAGKVMLFGAGASPTLIALQELGESLGLDMLPPLRTPFRDSDLAGNLSCFLPIEPAPAVPVDVDDALREGWLDLWYRPTIDLKQMALRGAEAEPRLCHPSWGVVAPASLIESARDSPVSTLADFVLTRAIADCARFADGQMPIELTLRLPIGVLDETATIERLATVLAAHPAILRVLVEVSSTELGRDPLRASRVAERLAACNIGICLDDVAAEASWPHAAPLAIAVVNIDARFVQGLGQDRRKRATCKTIIKIARQLNARTLAKGIATTADFKAASDLGVDLGQGDLFAKPMDAVRFARTMLPRRNRPPH